MSRRTRPIRVLLLLGSDRVGGAEKQALMLAKYARVHDVHCTLVSMLASDAPLLDQTAGNLFEEAAAVGVPTIYLNGRRMISPLAIYRFFRLIQRERYDAVYAYGFRAGVAVRPLVRLAGRSRMISSIRSASKPRHPISMWLDRALGRFCDAWISNSEAGRALFIEREKMPAEKVYVVPNGIETWDPGDYRDARPKVRQEWVIGEDELVVGTVARMTEAKGHLDIVQAASKVIECEPRTRFVFVGEGNTRAKIEEQIHALGLEDRIVLAGHADNVREVLAGIDIFLLGSRREGMPNALIEAMVAGKPCIATDVGDVAEMLLHGDGGLIVPPGDPEALALAVCHLAKDRQLAETMAVIAHQHCLDTYKPEFLAARFNNILEEIMNTTRR